MGGDHKCPVCQATFTRPQHVARHMRSHTGDRPYKCVYCGDQFARSDLLSRHVNKCHANEKPITQAGARRKGSAAATRAATSKQACDQCVQSSLPCDGCNPCAKCVQRKCRCTFVKFHRQTAPAGPGHAQPPSVSGVGQTLPPASNLMGVGSRLGAFPRSMHAVDPLGLGPVPLSAASSTSTGMNDPLYADQFSFGLYPSSAPTGSLSLDPSSDYTNRYRANAADLLRRDPIPPLPQSHQNGMTSSSWPGWSQAHDPHQDTRYPPHGQDGTDIVSGVSHTSGPYQHGFYTNGRRQSIDLDFSGSDSASHSDHSVPSSATSSSMHLPLGPMDGLSMPMSQSYQGSLGDGSSFPGDQVHSSQATSHHQRSSSQASNYENRDGFSSAFGLMSLDDPNVIAGLATDGAPFFSHAGMDTNLDPDATPMQVPHPVTQAPSRPPLQNRPSTSTGYHWSGSFPLNTPGRDREADTKELKDFWKQYMRTPLSGPGPANASSGSNQSQAVKLDTPGGMYRRPRVNSLPSVKTPLGPPGSSQYGYHQSHPFAIPTMQPKKTSGEGAVQANGIGSRTVHGTADDLRSYEAAVLARKAPTLSLNPRRRGTLSGAPPSGGFKPEGTPRPPSQQSDASSLANAFGGGGTLPPPHPTLIDIPRVTFGHEVEYHAHQMDSPVHDNSRESSVDVSDGSSGDGHEAQRPSFKRLPSQTLEPVNNKRTQLMRDNGDDGLGSGVGIPSNTSVPMHSKTQMSLADRRRMSVPSGPGVALELGPLPQ